jgi:hypothetical protein
MARPVREHGGRVEDDTRRAAPGVDDSVPGRVAQRGSQGERIGAIGVQR